MGSCFDYRDNAVLLIPVLPVRRSTYDLEYRCYIEDCSNLLRCKSVLQALIVTSVDYPGLVRLRACIYRHLLAR